ncbi:ABC transporter permease [bacterium]|jgi:putative ABC transport system permease protein|nr:ABC transporter permease [bacterium]
MQIKLALRNLLRNPRRTSTVLLTVITGSAALFIFHGFNAGLMNQYRESTIHSRYGHGQINTVGYREKVFEKPWEHWMNNGAQVAERLKQLPQVKQVFPRVEFFSLLTNGRVTVSGKGQGVDAVEEAKFFNMLNIEQGVALSDQADGILLGKGLARALDVKPGDRVTVLGNTIQGSINGLDLIVTGIFHTGQKEFDDVGFRIPLAQAQKLLETEQVESVALGLDSVASWDAVASVVRAEFPMLEATPFAVLDKVWYQNSVDWLDSQFGFIQFIILAIVILGIFSTVSIGVLERKQEIGNLRANGESGRQVLGLLILEGLALGALGAFLGLAIAWIINLTLLRNGVLMPPAPGITRQFYIHIELQPKMAAVAFLMGAVTSVLGTFLAGLKVARMPIGEALRSN